jgi:hypothetical protein
MVGGGESIGGGGGGGGDGGAGGGGRSQLRNVNEPQNYFVLCPTITHYDLISPVPRAMLLRPPFLPLLQTFSGPPD